MSLFIRFLPFGHKQQCHSFTVYCVAYGVLHAVCTESPEFADRLHYKLHQPQNT